MHSVSELARQFAAGVAVPEESPSTALPVQSELAITETDERLERSAEVVRALMPEVVRNLTVARLSLRNSPKEEQVDGDFVSVWSLILAEAGIHEREIGPAFVRFMLTEVFFPAPAQIIETAEQLRAENARRAYESEATRREREDRLREEARLALEAAKSDEQRERERQEREEARRRILSKYPGLRALADSPEAADPHACDPAGDPADHPTTGPAPTPLNR